MTTLATNDFTGESPDARHGADAIDTLPKNSYWLFSAPVDLAAFLGSALLSLVLLAAIVPVIALAAALRPSNGEQAATVAGVNEVDSPGDASASELAEVLTGDGSANEGSFATDAAREEKSKTNEKSPEHSSPATYSGNVTDDSGKPVAGAKLWLHWTNLERVHVQP